MIKQVDFKNQEIYTYASALLEAFVEGDKNLPVKVNFYLNKNINVIVDSAREIEAERNKIVDKYGTPNEDGSGYQIAPESIEVAQKELNDLFSLTQTIGIYMINLEAFGDAELTQKQMAAIMFMIDEEE